MGFRSWQFWTRNGVGAFADGAVLFPLLSALSLQSGFSGAMLLASAGLAYLAAAALFRVPMSVQPLKSIAIAGLAVGATSLEIRASGAVLGVFCLGLIALDVNRLSEKVPESLIHGVQLGLGVLLVLQGVKASGVAGDPRAILGLFLVVVVMTATTRVTRFPVLGVVAAGGLAWGVLSGAHAPVVARGLPAPAADESLRLGLVFSLVLPQLALTMANSVLGTRNVARKSFGAAASRVDARRLLQSIGLGNVVSALAGGVPFCHGSGGVTAHYRGGSTHWASNVIIGVALLVFAAVQAAGGMVQLVYPHPWIVGSLLVATGFFHAQLAAPTWAGSSGRLGRVRLAGMAVAALLTQNMLWVLVTGIVLEIGAASFSEVQT